MNSKKSRTWIVAGLLFTLFLIPSTASDGSSELLIVQTAGNQEFANPGTSGFSSSADLSVVITTQRGRPVSDLGPSFIGDGSFVINLTPEWTFVGNFTRPNGACALLPNQFFNIGNGIYVIRVISSPSQCPWVAGDYHYVVQIRRGRLQGSGLGILPIRSSF
jgi:hypothetical protein